jgi:hypothetical protein
MKRFQFHPELFDYRQRALDALAAAGFAWLSDFNSVDMMHDVYGLEVCAIRERADARAIEELLHRLFPRWHYRSTYYEDSNAGEIGWKVIVARDADECDECW